MPDITLPLVKKIISFFGASLNDFRLRGISVIFSVVIFLASTGHNVITDATEPIALPQLMEFTMSSPCKWGMLLILLTLALRLPAIVHPKPIDDEGGYAVVAHELLAGGTLYTSALDRRPPLIFWLYEAIFAVVGAYNWGLFHLLGVVWILLTMWGLYAISGDLSTPPAGLASALLYTVYTTTMYYKMLAFNGEVMMNLPIVWGFYFAFKPVTAHRVFELTLCGILLACAFLIKQPAAIAAIPAGVYVLLPAYRSRYGLRRRHAIGHAATLVISYFMTLGIVVLILYRQGVLDEAYYWTIKDHIIRHGSTGPVFWQIGIGMSLAFAVAWSPLLLLCALSVWQRNSGAGYWQHRVPQLTALLLLLGCSVIGVTAGGRFYPHYYLQLLPPLVLLAAPVLSAIWTQTRRYRFFMLQARVLWFLLGSTAVAFLVANSIQLWRLRPEAQLVRYIRQHSTPDARVFFWGETDYLYAEAQRRPASRYIHTFPLTGYIFGSPLRYDPDYDTTDRIRPGAWDILQAEFRRSPPCFFVDTDPGTIPKKYPPLRYPFLKRLLEQDYEVVLSTPEGIIYRRIAPPCQ